jgi:hypothetical protein
VQRLSMLVVSALSILPLARADAVLTAGSATAFSVGTVPISISGVSDLYDYQFDVGFDPSVLQLQSVTESSFLSGAGTTFFLPGFIDNTLGTASFIADTLIGPISGASGAGILVELNFEVTARGSTRSLTA